MNALIFLFVCFSKWAFGALVVPPSNWSYVYPYPVRYHHLTSQRMELSMAYMDIPPSNGSYVRNETIVLLHGKNFCGATWEDSIKRLSNQGYRVIVPDQVGFCKSSKPPAYQFSLQQLANNTKSLLDGLGVQKAHILGHSMGGMLATRFTLMYPDFTTRLILTNPLGLEDWKALGVPWRSIDLLYEDETKTSYTSLRNYQQATYYVNTWKPEYDTWVNMLLSLYQLPGENTTFEFDMALVTDAILTQPIVYEFGLIRAKTLLLIGSKDNTAIGKAWSPPDVQKRIGHYEELGKEAAMKIPRSELIEFTELGHAPQIQDSERYHHALLQWLEKP